MPSHLTLHFPKCLSCNNKKKSVPFIKTIKMELFNKYQSLVARTIDTITATPFHCSRSLEAEQGPTLSQPWAVWRECRKWVPA